MKTPITTLLAQKDRRVFSVTPETTVEAAVQEMNRRRIGCVLVLDNGRLVGVFTERDVLKRVVCSNRAPTSTLIAEVMTATVQTVTPETTIDDAMALITEGRHRHLPVVQTGEVVGLISIGDITRWLLQEHRNEADHLWTYITGTQPV